MSEINIKKISSFIALWLIALAIIIVNPPQTLASGCTWDVSGSGSVRCNFNAVTGDVIRISCNGCQPDLFSYGWQLYNSRGTRLATDRGTYNIAYSGEYYVIGTYSFTYSQSSSSGSSGCNQSCGVDSNGNYGCVGPDAYQQCVESSYGGSSSVDTSGRVEINIQWRQYGYRTPTPTPTRVPSATPRPTMTPVPVLAVFTGNDSGRALIGVIVLGGIGALVIGGLRLRNRQKTTIHSQPVEASIESEDS